MVSGDIVNSTLYEKFPVWNRLWRVLPWRVLPWRALSLEGAFLEGAFPALCQCPVTKQYRMMCLSRTISLKKHFIIWQIRSPPDILSLSSIFYTWRWVYTDFFRLWNPFFAFSTLIFDI